MDLKNIKPLEDFDWNSIGKKTTLYSEAEQAKLDEAYAKTFNQITEQEIIEGTIVSISDREVVVPDLPSTKLFRETICQCSKQPMLKLPWAMQKMS